MRSFIKSSLIALTLIMAVGGLGNLIFGDEPYTVTKTVWAAPRPEFDGAPKYAARVEIYSKNSVFLLTDLLGPWDTLRECKARLEQMRKDIEREILPKLVAGGHQIERWRGVCVDGREADLNNQTRDA